MGVRSLIVQQFSYDGSTYTPGEVRDTLSLNIGIKEIPFKYVSSFKDVAERDWPGNDGVDVYIPNHRRQKKYDTEIEFIYKGTRSTIHSDLRAFLDFFCGKKSDGSYVEPRFAMYDDHTKIGRKDVICSADFSNVDLFYYEDNDNDSIASFKLKFTVCDPVTDVVPTTGNQSLTWEGLV